MARKTTDEMRKATPESPMSFLKPKQQLPWKAIEKGGRGGRKVVESEVLDGRERESW